MKKGKSKAKVESKSLPAKPLMTQSLPPENVLPSKGKKKALMIPWPRMEVEALAEEYAAHGKGEGSTEDLQNQVISKMSAKRKGGAKKKMAKPSSVESEEFKFNSSEATDSLEEIQPIPRQKSYTELPPRASLLQSLEARFKNLKGSEFPTPSLMQSVITHPPPPPKKIVEMVYREALFDEFGMRDRFPLHKLQESRLLKLQPEKEYMLQYSGVEQMRDVVFVTLRKLKAEFPMVTSLDLSGCHYLTDHGISNIPTCFPALKMIALHGCKNLTELSLMTLFNGCKVLETVNMTATSLAVIPSSVAKLTLEATGCPLISPPLELLHGADGQILMNDTSKWHVLKQYKVCIVRHGAVLDSLLGYVSSQGKTQETNDRVKATCSLDNDVTINVFECSQNLLPILISKRGVYILTFDASADVKSTSKSLSQTIITVCAKIVHPQFLLIGLGKTAHSSTSAVWAKVKEHLLATCKQLNKALQGLSSPRSLEKTSDQDFTRLEAAERCVSRLDDVIAKTTLADINIATAEGYGTLKSRIQDTLKLVDAAFPEYTTVHTDLIAEIKKVPDILASFKAFWSMKEALEKLSSSGRFKKAPHSVLRKLLEFCEILGMMTVLKDGVQEREFIADPEWLLTTLHKLNADKLSESSEAPSAQTLEITCVPVNVLKMATALQHAAKSAISQDKLCDLLSVAQNVGILRDDHTTMLLSYASLTEVPHVDLSRLWDAKKPKTDMEIKTSYAIPHSLPAEVMCHLLSHVTSVACHVIIVWKTGILIRDGLIDVLIQVTASDTGQCRLDVICRSVKASELELPSTRHQSAFWHAAQQYTLIVDYLLNCAGVYSEVSCEHDIPRPDILPMVAVGHKYQLSSSKRAECAFCNISAIAARMLWTMQSTVQPYYMDSSNTKQDKAVVDVKGCVCISKEIAGQVIVPLTLSPDQNKEVSVTFISGEITGLKVTMRCGLTDITYCCTSGKLTYTSGTDKPTIDKKEIASELRPQIGDTINFRMTVSDDLQKYTLNVYRNYDILTQHLVNAVSGSSWKLELHHVAQSLIYMIRGCSEGTTNRKTVIEAGMKLEAKDRLTPSLICVATIEDINEAGLLLIHFDGWTSKYDYWAEPGCDDIHPIGFMYQRGAQIEKVNHNLQKPKNYQKTFDWSAYLSEENALPVPYEFFNESQTMGTPPDEEIRCLAILNESAIKNYWCMLNPNRARVLEYSVSQFLHACSQPGPENPIQKLWPLVSNLSKFFCLLPKMTDILNVRHPTRRLVTDMSQLKVHLLCSGQALELLHLVDHAGYDYTGKAAALKSCTPLLRFVMAVITKQQHFLPSGSINICPRLSSLSLEQAEAGVLRYMTMYLMLCELWSPWLHRPTTTDLNQSVNQIVNAVHSHNHASLGQQFIQVSTSELPAIMVCSAHNNATASRQELKEILSDSFRGFEHLIFQLDFQQNKLTKLGNNFTITFPNITNLNLSSNQITVFPDPLISLCRLEWLDISSNQLKVLPESMKCFTDKLTYLNISNNPLSTSSLGIVLEFVNLTELHANNIGEILDLKKIEKLKSLTILSLGGNKISCNLDSLASLKLVRLNLSGIPWLTGYDNQRTTLSLEMFTTFMNTNNVLKLTPPEEMKKIFMSCDASGNGMLNHTEVALLSNKLFTMFPRFGNTKSSGFPSCLSKIQTLHWLDLSFHAMKEIPSSIQSLSGLKQLNLAHNPALESIAAEVGSLPLKELQLKGCDSLKTPPKEVISRGFGAVYGYLKRLQTGSVSCKRTKLMLVGLGGAGKTTLIRALMDRRFQGGSIHYNGLYEMTSEQITDGIDITTWKIDLKDEPLEYSVWDFAGQTVYYNTHQFFLSSRAVYMLLWNIRLGYEHAGLDFWLSSLACHAPNAPVLIVGTHCDKVEKPKIPKEELVQRYPQIKGFHTVSSYNLQGIPELHEHLLAITLKEKYMGELIPEAWLSLEKKVKEKTEKEIDVLAWNEVESFAADSGIIEQTEVIEAVQFLHDLGSVQFFNTDFLRAYVVIHPQWIVDVMACVVTVHEGAIKDGVFPHKDMCTVWQEYPTELHPWLLRLTEEFDLTFPLSDKASNLVPCLLPNQEPKYNWPKLDTSKGHKETKMVYKFHYLPAGLFNRVQVRLHQFSDSSIVWKKGSMLKKNSQIALIKQISANDLLVRVQGNHPENILFLAHEVIEGLIAASFNGVQYDYEIPCMDCQAMQTLDPCMFSASKIQRAVELKAPFLQCDQHFHTLSIPEIQAIMPPDHNTDFDLQLGRSVRDLQNLHEDLSLSVMVMYCAENVKQAEASGGTGAVVNPKHVVQELKRDNFNVHTSEGEGDKTKLTLQIKALDVIVACVSDEFVEDQACCDLLQFSMETLCKPVVLIMLGQSKAWLKSKAGMFLTNEIYIVMKPDRYEQNIKEIEAAIKHRTAKSKTKREFPSCFVSYCWCNSQEAVSRGYKSVEGAIGWGDPRQVKGFLHQNGINCWMDVEQVGRHGLYEDIAEGLRHAKLMVACVSDEYATSRNCQMEFRYAISTLKIPTVLAVMGNGYQWERTEIGMLSGGYNCPKINFQYETTTAHLDLLKSVQDKLPKQVTTDNGHQESEQKIAFQEVLELAQHKFLRHITAYIDTIGTAPYPRLIVMDICTASQSDTVDGIIGDRARPTSLCFSLLCEHDRGWHSVTPSIKLPDQSRREEDAFLRSTAAYCARIISILKHTDLNLELLKTSEGQKLQTQIEQMCTKTDADFKNEYTAIRHKVMELDTGRVMGNLKKCHLSNGKLSWLCEEHQNASGKKSVEFKKSPADAAVSSSASNTMSDQGPIKADTTTCSYDNESIDGLVRMTDSDDECTSQQLNSTLAQPKLLQPITSSQLQLQKPDVSSRACMIM